MSHRFYEADATHHACEDCDVIVDGELLDAVTLECPARACDEPSNHGEPCVFIASCEGPECAYCGRPGDPEWRDADGDEDPGR